MKRKLSLNQLQQVSNFSIAGYNIAPGTRKQINLDVAKLYDYTDMTLTIEVIHGKEPGPVMFVSAAMQGDEIIGVEIIKRLLKQKIIKKIKGTLIVVPIVNIFGYNNKSRYLPDRRDLNRCFPDSENGALAARLAKIFLDEIVKICDYDIDLHTAAVHRSNLPQIRACLDDPILKKLAIAFGAPVVVNSKIREGSLREASLNTHTKLLVYEAGEALRFDEKSIQSGLLGILSVMKEIDMLEKLPFIKKN